MTRTRALIAVALLACLTATWAPIAQSQDGTDDRAINTKPFGFELNSRPTRELWTENHCEPSPGESAFSCKTAPLPVPTATRYKVGVTNDGVIDFVTAEIGPMQSGDQHDSLLLALLLHLQWKYAPFFLGRFEDAPFLLGHLEMLRLAFDQKPANPGDAPSGEEGSRLAGKHDRDILAWGTLGSAVLLVRSDHGNEQSRTIAITYRASMSSLLRGKDPL